MTDFLPPTIDPIAAQRWQRSAPATTPWLHDEVGQRMQQRLDWIAQKPRTWCHWQAVRGGLHTHALIAQRYPEATCLVVEPSPHMHAVAQQHWRQPWWQRWRDAPTQVLEHAPEGSADLLWGNMLLHTQADPLALLRQWHSALALEGCLMFSCLGPDTVRELRALYQQLGWPAPGHDQTDMHDWGDMLIQAGFADPVMDMETITLGFASAQRLLQELRGLGRNFHPQRFAGLRGRGWLDRLHDALQTHARLPDGQLGLRFEIVYGHAFKAAPRGARQWKKSRADR